MVKTEHGIFAGDTWEEFCQLCFKLKYEPEGYQTMPAWQGDLGIEGFTRTGRVFQCYCPDFDYPPDKLYEEQRDKISRDLNKLITYEKQLKSYLKDIKIKEWIFVTPLYKKKDLVKHCRDKAEEFRAKASSILDSTFDVIIHDLGNFTAQVPLVKGYQQKKVEINPKTPTTDKDIIGWKSKEIPYVNNAIRKHEMRLPENAKNKDGKIELLTHNSIRDFLNGDIVLRTWQITYEDDYEKFIRIISQFETKVKEKCVLSNLSNNLLYSEIESELKIKLKEAFSILDSTMIDRLSDYVMADWIIRCPIDFE